MNYNNYAQKTNYTAGSDQLELLPFYLTTLSLPGVQFALPELGGRGGAKLNLNSDNISFNALSIEMIIDEDFELYQDFMSKFFSAVDVEKNVFRDEPFDFWIEINNSKGHKLMKYEFSGCRLESIGDIQLDTQDDSTEFTMSVELKYDYYTIIGKDRKIPVIDTNA